MSTESSGSPSGYSIVLSVSSSNTKGSYVELIASIGADSSRFWAAGSAATSTTHRHWLVDYATGAASSEVIILNNWWIVGGGYAQYPSSFLGMFDFDIASGTRLSARCQANGTGLSLGVNVYVSDRALESLSTLDSYGLDTASSAGTQIDPGGSANTKGSYSELAASTSNDLDVLHLAVGINNAFAAVYNWAVDVATGAAASEVVVHADLIMRSRSVIDALEPAGWNGLYEEISAGTRLAVRAACSGTDATDRLFRCALYGSDLPAGGTTTVEAAIIGSTSVFVRGRMRAQD